MAYFLFGILTLTVTTLRWALALSGALVLGLDEGVRSRGLGV